MRPAVVASLRPAALLLAVVLAGCRETAPASSGGAVEDPARQRVRRFWKTLNLATEARLRGDLSGAASRYEEALELEPRHEDGLYYLGQCRRGQARPGEARRAFERLVAVNPHSARGHLALGALLASPDAAEPMDLVAAEEHLRRAHEINGEETGPVVRLGEVLLVAGRDDEARGLLQGALRTNPRSVEAAFLAGLTERGRGRAAARRRDRVRQAAVVEAPVKGVLNEGDRRSQDGRRLVAPPLQSPLGRLLFGEPIDVLRSRVAAGEPLTDELLERLWTRAEVLRAEFSGRAAGREPPRQ